MGKSKLPKNIFRTTVLAVLFAFLFVGFQLASLVHKSDSGEFDDSSAATVIKSASPKLVHPSDWQVLFRLRPKMLELCADEKVIGVDLSAMEESLFQGITPPPLEHKYSHLAGKMYFFAVLLHNNDDVAPTLLVEMTKLLMLLRPPSGSMGNFFVSIYESGSTDMTDMALDVFQEYLNDLGIANRVVINGTARAPAQNRIDFLADLRNQALLPLYTSPIEYDHLVFFNDVYVCANAALQLIAQVESGGDMACGADYLYHQRAQRLYYYDVWATLDVTGQHFSNEVPYVIDPASWERHSTFQPYQVLACWGGLAVFPASIFQKQLIRFRRSLPLECAASECELLPRDLWSINRTHVVIVPSVQTTYDLASFLHVREHLSLPNIDVPFTPLASWTHTRPEYSFCCPLEDADEMEVDFRHCIKDYMWWWYDIFGTPRADTRYDLRARLPPNHALKPTSVTMHQLLETIRSSEQCDIMPHKRIPRRIVQLWRTNHLTRLRQHVFFPMMSWVLTHPCYEHVLVPHNDMIPFVLEFFPDYAPDFVTLSRGDQSNLFRFLYMHKYGGIYADIDTVSVKSMEHLIDPADTFVVGLESDFTTAQALDTFTTARQRTIATHCFAVEPGSRVLLEVINRVMENIRDPGKIFNELHSRTYGFTAHLEVSLRSGPGPFSDVILQSSAKPGAVRVLGLNVFSKLPKNDRFIEQTVRTSLPPSLLPQEDNDNEANNNNNNNNNNNGVRAVKKAPASGPTVHNRFEPETHVLHFNMASWLSMVGDWQTKSLNTLPMGAAFLSGTYMLGRQSDSLFGTDISALSILWRSGLQPDAPKDGNYFLWLRASSQMPFSQSQQGCMGVFHGLGPSDTAKYQVWAECWDAASELDNVFAVVQGDGNLVVYTTEDYFCDPYKHTTEPDTRVLWASNQVWRGHSDYRLLVSAQGEAMVVSRLPIVVENSFRFHSGVWGKCHPKYALPPATATSAEHAQHMCNLASSCNSYFYDQQLMVHNFFPCRVPTQHQPIHQQETAAAATTHELRESVGYGVRLATDNHFVRISGWADTCASGDLLDVSGRKTVSSREDAEQLCILEPSCMAVEYAMNEDPATGEIVSVDVKLCRSKGNLLSSQTIAKPSEIHSVSIKRSAWNSKIETGPTLPITCITSWVPSAKKKMCLAVTTVWQRISQRIQKCE